MVESGKYRVTTIAWLTVLLAIAVGAMLATQGWAAYFPTGDLSFNYADALEFLRHGIIPYRGNVTSLGSYNTPGTGWLVAAGLWLMPDFRCAELPMALALYAGTTIGVFAICREAHSTRAGIWAAWAYALSVGGLFTANSLWSVNQNPFFVVWICFFLLRWVRHRRSRDLSIAMLFYGLSLLFYPTTLPAVLVPLVLILVYRPPLGWSLSLVVVLISLLFLPYLRYESTRGWIDVRSLVRHRDINPVGKPLPFCDSSLKIHDVSQLAVDASPATTYRPLVQSRPSLPVRMITQLATMLNGVLENLRRNSPGGIGVIFLVPVGWLIVVTATAGETTRRRVGALLARAMTKRIAMVVGIILLILAVTANEYLVLKILGGRLVVTDKARLNLRIGQIALAALGLGLIFMETFGRLLAKAIPDTLPSGTGALVLILVILWLPYVVLAESGRGDRLWQLWPLQVAVLAIALIELPAALHWHKFIAPVFGTAMIVIVLFNPIARTKIRALAHDGWRGPDSPRYLMLSDLAARLHASGVSQAAIGYNFNTSMDELTELRADSRFRVGWTCDLYLNWKHDIRNGDQCPEGISAADEWRIVDPRTTAERDKLNGIDTLQILATDRADRWEEIVAQAGPVELRQAMKSKTK